MSDDQNNGENQGVAPKTGKQVALWLQRGRMALARQKQEARRETRDHNRLAAEATPTAETPVSRSSPLAPPPSRRSVAAFLWMPQIHLSFQAFTFPLALMVQTFAQILVTVGLLPADHPARSYSGAKSFGITQLLEEARAGLPPLRTLWGDGTRILATRQYAIFASTIGVLATGAMTLLTMFTQIFFGFAQAFAQSPYNQAGDFSIAGDLGIGFINAIFDPTGSSVTSSGLGELFRIYSSAMLIFAGIIVLWIIISAVAETARTGIPFGKQFNHVWAPIRLVVALGLLIPLGSGLNSGQHLVIYLTQWGSEQANMMWVTFADKTAISGSSGNNTGGNSQIPGALSAVPVTQDSYKSISDKLFDILLCQSIYNKIAGTQSLSFMPDPSGSVLTTAPNATIIDVNGNQSAPTSSNYQVRQFNWQVPGELNCGSANFPELKPNANGQNASAAGITAEQVLAEQSSQLTQFMNLARAEAEKVAQAAVNAQNSQHPSFGKMDLPMLDFYSNYQNIANAYAAARTNSIRTALSSYNGLLGLNFQSEAKTRGWISAPVWLNRIAEQNGRVLDVASVFPNIESPPVSGLPLTASNNGGLSEQVAGDIQGTWNIAQTFLGKARQLSPAPAQTDPLGSATELMRATFGEILKPNSNPLGTIGGFGRNLMTQGVDIAFNSAKGLKEDGSVQTCGDALGTCDVNGPNTSPTALLLQKFDAAMKKDNADGNPATWGVGTSGAAANAALTNDFANQFNQMPASVMRPVGTMLISFGFMAGYVLPLLPFFRFMLGVLGWVLLLFEAILAMPLLAISLLKTDGEGFMTQNFQTGAVMILALIIRPMLMIFGLLLGLMAFNGIMNITNVSYLAAIGGTDSNLDNSLLSMVVYLIIYGILAYTLANSAFKAIDILPNQVMSWLGARLDQRVDDASTIHQQTSGMVNQLGMVSAMGGMGAGGPRNQQGSGDFIGPRQSPGTSGGSGVEPPRPG